MTDATRRNLQHVFSATGFVTTAILSGDESGLKNQLENLRFWALEAIESMEQKDEVAA